MKNLKNLQQDSAEPRRIINEEGQVIAECNTILGNKIDSNNAAKICQRVNSYDKLISEIKMAEYQVNEFWKISEAIKKGQKGTPTSRTSDTLNVAIKSLETIRINFSKLLKDIALSV